jgi:2-dehydropantoate 2-reductase
MRTLVYGAGPIGQWLALRLHRAGRDVTLLARGETLAKLRADGVVLVDGYTGEKLTAHVGLVDRIEPEDAYDLVIVPMRKASRLAVCSALAANSKLENILFLGNDISGFHRYFDVLPKAKVLLGFPSTGGGMEGEDLVFVDRDKPNGKTRPIHIGELSGGITERMKQIQELLAGADVPVSVEPNIDGWLKYHFAFVVPMAGAVLKCNKDVRAVGSNKKVLRQYVLACREAGNVLRKAGYPKRQPPIFNLFYWTPLWLVPKVFKPLFDSRFAEVAIGLHLNAIGNEFAEMADEFSHLQAKAGIDTPNLNDLLRHIPREQETN